MDSKQNRILSLLQTGSLNRFEAERVGDHCLNTTIARLRALGHEIISHRERVPNRFGGLTSVNRYYILQAKEKADAPTAQP